MVQAILEGRKTMTRRTKGLEEVNKNPNDWKFDRYAVDMVFDQIGVIFSNDNEEIYIPFKANVGDVFWVRETFAEWPKVMFQYKASTSIGSEIGKWKPSIFMPKQACRIFLKVKTIRVERLQDISEEDAIAEGVNCLHPFYEDYLEKASFYHLAVDSFMSLWKSINGRISWDTNPFVFVYEFEQIEKPLDFI